MRTILIPLLLLAVGLAGCASDDEPQQEQAMDVPALQGWVFDEGQRPLGGAEIEILQTGDVATVAADGSYNFTELPIDQELTLVATLDAYKPSSKAIVLPAEAPHLLVNFTLELLPVKVAYTEHIPFKGHLTCQGSVVVTDIRFPVQCAGEEAQDMWDIAAGPDLAGIVVEVGWQSGGPHGDYIHATLETLSLGDLNQVLVETTGTSILRMEVPRETIDVLYSQGGLMRLTVETAIDPSQDTGASMHVSQDIEAVVSLFYVDPPPPGFSVQG